MSDQMNNGSDNPSQVTELTAESLLLYRDEARLIEAWRGWLDTLSPHLEVGPPTAEPIRSGALGGWRLTGSMGPL